MKLERLHGRKINDYLMRKGMMWKGKTMNIRWLSGSPKSPNVDRAAKAIYLGTFASTSLHKSAVKRNRMRRRCREAMRLFLQKATDLPTAQLLLSPRIASLDAPFPLIEADIAQFFSNVRSWPQPKAPPHASSTSPSSSRSSTSSRS